MSTGPSLGQDDVGQAVQEMRRLLSQRYGEDVDPLPLAAIGLAQRAWRNIEVEGVHGGPASSSISDGEMFAANVATTRLVSTHLRSFPTVDWDALIASLIDPDRIAGRRSVRDLLGDSYQSWSDTVYGVIGTQQEFMARYGAEFFVWFNASCSLQSTEWWGSPEWPAIAEKFVEDLKESPPGIDPTFLRKCLIDAPDELDPEILEWCVDRSIGYTHLD